MASYPGAVKTFTSRSAGQTIDASHINDLQDEVNAIESGLLTGSAPLVSSGITAASLNVSGGTTLATLVVTTPSDAVQAFSAVTIGVAHNTLTAISFDSHRSTAGAALHSTGTATFTAGSSGWFLMRGSVLWNDNSSGQRQLGILKNGLTVIAQDVLVAPSVSSAALQHVTALANFGSTDAVQLTAFQDSGSTASIKAGGSVPFQCEFSMVKLR